VSDLDLALVLVAVEALQVVVVVVQLCRLWILGVSGRFQVLEVLGRFPGRFPGQIQSILAVGMV
jgi:hypothetical protein